MPWLAQLELRYSLAAARTRLHFRHDGPLRVLRSLYPEGDSVCHNVLVHPPGGLVSGDTLDIRVHVDPHAHALVTTPGATRFYRSSGSPAHQRTQLHLATGAKLEWLPLEALAYNACDAHNHLEFTLDDGAELMAWDITALGLPYANEPFVAGCLTQHMHWPGRWLERGRLQADDDLLLNGPLGLAGKRCMGSLFLACGTALSRPQREALLEHTRALLDAHPLGTWCGITAPNDHMVVLRGLSDVVEPLMQLWQQVRLLWRQQHWQLPATSPRIWNM